jgi:hypothetical protein
VADRKLSLDEAVMGAGEAPPSVRIEFRDQIAQYGAAGIERVVPWLADPKMAAFAVRVIARAAEFGAPDDARRALHAAIAGLPEPARSDAGSALEALGVRRRQSPGKRGSSATTTPAIATSLEDLIEDKVYKRRDLHQSGLGGNWQKGISYPAGGTYVLLFSDPDSKAEWGYQDTWDGPNTYRYYGEWDGTGDMLMRGGNLEVVERSPEIYLFVKVPNGHRYAGIFELQSQERAPATRDNKQFMALVFTLVRRSVKSQ